MTLIGALVLMVAACGSASPAATSAPATPTPAATTPAPVTPAPTATPVEIAAAVTFDGQTCTYSGPSVIPRGASVTFTMTHTPAASLGAMLWVGPVLDGTTWEDVLAYASGKAQDIPPWAYMPDFGLGEARFLYPDRAKAGETLTTVTTRNLYLVLCATAPTETDKAYPAILLQVLDR